MLSLPVNFLLCSFELPHSTTMSPCLLFVSQMSLPVRFQLFFLAFLLFFPIHQVPVIAFQNPGHLLSKRFLTACLFQFPPSYVWLYFLCFFLFYHERHFAYHHTVLPCDALIQYYFTILHFLQVPPSAHHIIYLGTFSATFVHYPVLFFLLEISVDNRQIHPFRKIYNHRSFLISRSSTVPPDYFLIPYVSFAHMSI